MTGCRQRLRNAFGRNWPLYKSRSMKRRVESWTSAAARASASSDSTSVASVVWRANYTPKLKKRTALLRKLKEVFRRYQSQPVDRVVKLINPILRGWVNYFAVGHSSECFSFIQDWVEKKVRRHMGRAQNRKGFGWKRWSRQWLYETLRLFNGYRIRRPMSKVAPAG